MKIKTYKYEKIEVSETELFIPQEPYYAFETGIRRSIRIIPKWTIWNKDQYQEEEEILHLEVTCIYLSFECKIEKFTIQIHEIENLINTKNTDAGKKSIVDALLANDLRKRTKEQFDIDLESAINSILK